MYEKALIVLMAVLAFAINAQAADGPPNVVLLISDDQSWTDYGFMGHPHVQTPKLGRLAGAGILYERGYVTAPLCRPSLASIVTGLYPHQTGVRNNDPKMPNGASRKTIIQKDPDLWREMRARMTAPMLEHPSLVRSSRHDGTTVG